MARKSTFFGSSKALAIGVVQTIVFSPSDLVSSGVIAYHFAMNTAANQLAQINRVRIRAAGDLIWDATVAQLQAYQQRWSRANTADAATQSFFTIPLNMLDNPSNDAADAMQTPPGAEIQIEIVTLNTIAANGAISLGWTVTDQAPKFSARYTASQMNIPASVRNGRYSFSRGGIVRGLTLPQTGIDRLRVEVAGREAWNLPGPAFQDPAVWGNMLQAKDFLQDGNVITTTKHLAVDLGLPGAQGSTFLEMDTGAGWGGAANEVGIYSVDSVG